MIRTLNSLLPLTFRESLYYRLLHGRHKSFPSYFEKVPLQFARDFKMYDLIIGDVISGSIAFTGFYELGLSKEVERLSQEGGLMVDVGANLGYFSLLWLAGNPNNRVVSVEAAPRNQAKIQQNFTRNGVVERAELLAHAAGDQNGGITFDLGPEEQTGWGGIATNETGNTTVEVEMKRLDSILDEEIALLKIDVEGADTLVLKGCEKLLRAKKVKRLYFEQHLGRMEQLGIQPGEAQDFLKDCGYICEPFGKGDGELVAWPE
jgi:FkbM family methyltransferase